jgi:transposase
MAKEMTSDKMEGFSRMKFQGSAMLIRWWKGPPVIVLVPSAEPIRIRRRRDPIQFVTKIPSGSLRAIPLTGERKRFLLKQGVDPELIKKGYVFDVSDALASAFDKQREAVESLAAKIGLTKRDLLKILEAKRKLAAFQPSNRMERLAKRGLESMFSSKPPKKEAGRPSRISAEERQEMRVRAMEMRAAGKSRDEIVAQLAEEYELRLSYVRRILEDRPKPENRSTQINAHNKE